MNYNEKTAELLNYSISELARKHLDSCSRLTIRALFLPLPLIGTAVLGFFHFQPQWYNDLFLCSILALFVFGQLGAFIQMICLRLGTKKAGKTITIVQQEGDRPDLDKLQKKLLSQAPPCHTRDTVLRWIQLGIQGETRGLEQLMQRASERRSQVSTRIISLHVLINRITLKMGFLGTLIGLFMTFEPMKQAMLSLQGSHGEFGFISDTVKAIDGNAYAILTTLFATGLSIFIELLTIQILGKITGRFEMVNNNLDDWCVIHLQPWIRRKYSSENNSVENLIGIQKEFSEKIGDLNSVMNLQLCNIAKHIEETGRHITSLIPLEKELAAKIALLTKYESEYRRFINTKFQELAPAVVKMENENG